MTEEEVAVKKRERPKQLSRWITLGRACELIGVNESTLRRWADAGKVKSFRTPGGHRRFTEEDALRAITAGHTYEPKASAYETLGEQAMGRIRRRLQRGRGHEARWYQDIDEGERERLRPLGRRIISLVEEYLSRRSRRQRVLQESRELGRQYGYELSQGDLSLRDGIAAFAFFRGSVDETAIEMLRRGTLAAGDAAEVWEGISSLSDQVLLSMAEAYYEARPAMPAGRQPTQVS